MTMVYMTNEMRQALAISVSDARITSYTNNAGNLTERIDGKLIVIVSGEGLWAFETRDDTPVTLERFTGVIHGEVLDVAVTAAGKAGEARDALELCQAELVRLQAQLDACNPIFAEQWQEIAALKQAGVSTV